MYVFVYFYCFYFLILKGFSYSSFFCSLVEHFWSVDFCNKNFVDIWNNYDMLTVNYVGSGNSFSFLSFFFWGRNRKGMGEGGMETFVRIAIIVLWCFIAFLLSRFWTYWKLELRHFLSCSIKCVALYKRGFIDALSQSIIFFCDNLVKNEAQKSKYLSVFDECCFGSGRSWFFCAFFKWGEMRCAFFLINRSFFIGNISVSLLKKFFFMRLLLLSSLLV